MLLNVFVVTGVAGQWDSHRRWQVCYYESREDAEACVQALRSVLARHGFDGEMTESPAYGDFDTNAAYDEWVEHRYRMTDVCAAELKGLGIDRWVQSGADVDVRTGIDYHVEELAHGPEVSR